MDANLNARWCRCIAEELHRAGLAGAVLCPGSRNSPLLFALAAELGPDRCLSQVDERSGAFIALGLARASGRPALVCVTSGSAVANCLPAVVEAQACGLPLVVVAADRPWELHGCGAPQTMAQAGVLAPFLAGELALGEPTGDDRALRALRARVSRLAQLGGPVLINAPLRDPLPPLPDPAFADAPGLSPAALAGRPDGAPYTAVAPRGAGDAGLALDLVDLRPGRRGVIVAGASPTPYGASHIADLAALTGFPLLADAGSNLRRSGLPGLVTTADALVAGPLGAEPPEVVVQVGQAPLARRTYEWLDRCRGPWIALEDGGSSQDWLARAQAAIPAADARAARLLAERLGRGDPAWALAWADAESAARQRLDDRLADGPWGAATAADRALHHPGFAWLSVANSLSARLANLLLRPSAGPRPVLTARGLAGIDGTLGAFIGASRLLGRGLLLVGDLAALHDLPALAACQGGQGGAVVVLNNQGGAIFDHLAVSQVPGYRQWVRTDHGLDLAHAAAQFDLGYHACDRLDALDTALDAAAAGGWHLVECRLGAEDPTGFKDLLRAVAGSPPTVG